MPRAFAHLISALLLTAGVLGLSAVSLAPAGAVSTTIRPLFGVTVPNVATLRADTHEFGRMRIIHAYYHGLPKSNTWTTGVPGRARSAVIVSFNAMPREVLSGRDDRVLSRFFRDAPRRWTVYWNYFHEPEDNIAAHQFTATAFRAAWRHVDRLASRAHNRHLRATVILMAWDLRKGSHRDWRDYFPGRRHVAVLGWDAYPRGAVQGHPELTPPREFMGGAVALSRRMGMRFGFAEFGMENVPGRAGWLHRVGRYLTRRHARFGTLFNSGSVRPPMILSGASAAAWRSVVASSRPIAARVMAYHPAGPATVTGTYKPVVVTGVYDQPYTIRRGDTLSKIAKMFYGSPRWWPQLFYQNKKVVKNPGVIVPGEKLLIHQRWKNPPKAPRVFTPPVAALTVHAASGPAPAAPAVSQPAPAPVAAGVLSYGQIEALWVAAGGPAAAEAQAASIAECESGGRTDAYNPSGATGLFQILGQVVPGNLYDPMVNTENAVAKYRASGDTFAQWVCQ